MQEWLQHIQWHIHLYNPGLKEGEDYIITSKKDVFKQVNQSSKTNWENVGVAGFFKRLASGKIIPVCDRSFLAFEKLARLRIPAK